MAETALLFQSSMADMRLGVSNDKKICRPHQNRRDQEQKMLETKLQADKRVQTKLGFN